MKKVLLVILLVLAVMVVIGFSFNAIIEKGVERYGSLATGTAVRMEDADISLFSGKGRIKGLVISNPAGFETKNAFSIDEARVAMNVRSLLSDRLTVYEIYIDSPVVTYEKGRNTNNIKTILENIEKFAGGAGGQTGEDEGVASEKKEQKVEIDNFVIKNGRVNMSASALKGEEISLDLPDMHLKDIGKEGEGASLPRVMELVFAKVNRNIGAAVTGSAGDIRESVEKEIKEETGGTVDELKGILGD